MDISKYFDQKKELNSILLSFLECENEYDTKQAFQQINEYITKEKIGENREEFQILLRLISKISNNHHRHPKFMKNVKQILLSLSDYIKQHYSNIELFNLFKDNKPILLFFLEQNILIMDEDIFSLLRWKSDKNGNKYCHFFYPELQHQLDEKIKQTIEEELKKNNPNIFLDFEEKRHEGENDSYICQIIRNDSVEDFISHVNKLNVPLSSSIVSSIFETNLQLSKKNPTLIEYSVFFGSIQIFQYLKFNNVEMNESLLLYAIYSNTPEMIHLLEENNVKQENFGKILSIAVKCHHNEIVRYFLDKLPHFYYNINDYCFKYDNFVFLQSDFGMKELCQFDYVQIVKDILDEEADISYLITLFDSAVVNNSLNVIQFLIPKIIKKPGDYFEEKYFSKNKKLTKFKYDLNFKHNRIYFFGDISLTHVTLPESIEIISRSSFLRCHSLLNINIPSSVKIIDQHAFEDCFSLFKINFYQNEKKSIKKSLLNGSIENFAFKNCYSLKEIEIPSSIELIKEYSFVNCTSLNNVKLHPSVSFIGYSAFFECPNLNINQLNLPKSLKNVGLNIFSKDEFLFEKDSIIFFENESRHYGMKDLLESCIEENKIQFVKDVDLIFKYDFIINDRLDEQKGYISFKIPMNVNEIIQYAKLNEKKIKFNIYPSVGFPTELDPIADSFW